MSLTSNIVHETATAAVAINYTFTPAGEVELLAVRLHLSAAGGAVENLVIYVDSGTAAAHDVVLNTTAMVAVQDVHFQPDTPFHIAKGDVLDITYTNTNLRTYGLDIIYRKLY